jgi:hypothetical protein
VARLLGGGSSAPALLLLVLLCVVASFGMLLLGLFTGGTGWAWGSIAASAAGGVLLIVDWVSRRRTTPGPSPPADRDTPET